MLKEIDNQGRITIPELFRKHCGCYFDSNGEVLIVFDSKDKHLVILPKTEKDLHSFKIVGVATLCRNRLIIDYAVYDYLAPVGDLVDIFITNGNPWHRFLVCISAD